MAATVPVLEIQTGKYKGRKVKLAEAEVVIGRGDEAKVRIASSEVSRQHCILLPQADGQVLVRDLGSRNGTFIDGRPIQGERLLPPGSNLTVGPLTFQLVGHKSAPAPGGPVDVLGKGGTDQALSDDDIAAMLSDDELPVQSTDSDTTEISSTGHVDDQKSSGTIEIPAHLAAQPKKREFKSIAEEAEDIIRRHYASLENEGSSS